MEKFIQKENTGSIFKNDRKETDKHPDYTGTINVEGKEWQISLWVKDGKKGKFFSASIKAPYVKSDLEVQKANDLPF